MKPADPCILTINGGSSSIKFAVYRALEPLKRKLYGTVDRIGMSGTSLTFHLLATNQQDSRSLDALDGLDTLVFAGRIGENAPLVRARICDRLGFLGIALSESRNADSAGVISTDASRATVRVIPTDQDLMIARSVYRILETGAGNAKD
jgi:acetate kinase